ncbi:MAG: helix-turn-helix transcriptional regulator [Candidatus Omnitrophica bacterium]|nr:helix-turn-helix transcriptional regulator [Candidatus Omnitrophota bacterium]
MTQAALAERAGSTQAGISQIERGRRSPTLRTVFRLSSALGIPPAQLLGSSPEGPLSREGADRIARAIVQAGPSALSARERRFAEAAGSLVIQKLRAHRAPGGSRYARVRRDVLRRCLRVRQLYGDGPVRQVLHRVDALLSMRGAAP